MVSNPRSTGRQVKHTPLKLRWAGQDIEDDDSGMLAEALDHLISEPTAASRDDDDLGLVDRAPIEWRARLSKEIPVVQSKPVQPGAEAFQQTDGEQVLQRLDQQQNALG
jgi:hypothetical protein